MDSEDGICRLCCHLHKEQHMQVINEYVKEMLDILLIKLDLGISENPVICTICNCRLKEHFKFKMKCICNEKMLAPFVTKNVKINLNEIRNSVIKSEEEQKDKNVCRLCLEFSSNDMTLSEHEEEQFQKFFPEVNLKITKFVIVCPKCYDTLQNHFIFISSCLELEEKLFSYYLDQAESEDNKSIKLERFYEFTVSTTDYKQNILLSDEVHFKDELDQDSEDACSTSRNFKKQKRSCSIMGCQNHNYMTGISFFRFPKEPARCAVWIRNSGRTDLSRYSPEHLYRNYKICSEHFDLEMFTNYTSKMTLKKYATPQINSISSHSETILESKSTKNQGISHSSGAKNAITYPDKGVAVGGVSMEMLYMVSKNSSHSSHLIDAAVQTSQSISPEFDDDSQTTAFQNASEPTKEDVILAYVRPFITKQFEVLLETYFQLKKEHAEDFRYSSQYQQFALALYFSVSNSEYRFIQKLLDLPSKAMLYSISNNWNISSGFNNSIFNILESKVNIMTDAERHCVLCMDEMPLKKFLFYYRQRDFMVGFHETLNGKKFVPAKSVFVIMAQGLFVTWKQPLVYFFVDTIEAEEIGDILLEAVKKLHNIKMFVHALVSDMKPNFTKFTKVSGISDNKPFILFNDQKIFYFYDVPYLLESTRNTFFNHNILSQNGVIKSEHLLNFYEQYKKVGFSLGPKLTDQHFDLKMFKKTQVKFAAQVFSYSVVKELHTYLTFKGLPSEANATTMFIEKMNRLFDLFNTEKVKRKRCDDKIFRGTESQINFLYGMLKEFSRMEIQNVKNDDLTEITTFIKGWKLSINALLGLWEDVKEYQDVALYTRRLNHDHLQHFFDSMTNQDEKLTPVQFSRKFKQMFVSCYFRISTQSHSNEENGIDSISKKIETFENVTRILQFQHLDIGKPDYLTLSFKNKNLLYYISEFLLKRCFEKHCCRICLDFSKIHCTSLQQFLVRHDICKSKNLLVSDSNVTAPNNFVDYMCLLEKKFLAIFDTYVITQNPGQIIKSHLKSLPHFHPCPEFPLDYFLSVYVRIKIFNTLRQTNKQLKMYNSKRQ